MTIAFLLRRIATFLPTFVLMAGCGWFAEPEYQQTVSVRTPGLPDTIPELMALADEKLASGTTIHELSVAVSALEKAEELLGAHRSMVGPGEISERLAHACYLIAEIEYDATKRTAWLLKGEDAAESAIRNRPDRVGGYYYLAVLIGRRAEQVGLSALVMVKRVEELGLQAVELDEHFENGGPLRLLAMLYANAPPWPTSVGDVDLALEYAERAVAADPYPLNHLVYAEVLIEAEEFPLAREQLRRVLAAPKAGRWAQDGEHWRPHARKLLRQIGSE